MTAHSLTLDVDHGTSVQLVCSCGWADLPWHIVGLDSGYLALVAERIEEADVAHHVDVGWDVPIDR